MFQSAAGCSASMRLVGQPVGRADPGAAGLPGVVEGVLVDLAGGGVVDDVAGGHAVVLAPEPGVDPEGLDPDDLLLVVGHAAGDVHQVEDDGVGLRQVDRVPGAVELVLADGDDDRVGGVVGVRGDLPLQGLLVGPLEVAEALGAGLADAGVLVLLLDDVGLALGLDAGQLQLLAEDLGELVHGQLDLEDVLAGAVAGLARRPPRRRRSGRSAGRRRRAPGRRRRSPSSRSGTRGGRSTAGGSRPARRRSCRSSRRG